MLRALIFTLSSLIIFLSSPALATTKGETILYKHGAVELEGYMSPSQCLHEAPAPVVLIVHQWKGVSNHEKQSADKLAEQCYNTFVIDMYGKGIRPADNTSAGKEAGKYKNNPKLARDRLQSALDFAKKKYNTDQAAIMGYCFGGTMALELARSGADIAGAVSFHGGLSTNKPATKPGQIKSAVLVHHGDAEIFVKQPEVDAFFKEMRTSNADWHFIRYADAVHAFTHEDAGSNPSTGVAYNERATKRSWQATLNFLEEIF